MTTMIEEARRLDRALNAARDPEEMKTLIGQRRLARAGMAFDHAMSAYEEANPVPDFPDRLTVLPAPIADRTVGPPAAVSEAWLESLRAEAIERNRASGRDLCRQCGTILGRDELTAYLHAGWCWTCSLSWFETRCLGPLVRALGCRQARRAMLGLVRRLK